MSDDPRHDPKPVNIVAGDGETYARGVVESTRAIATKPCFMCKAFDKPDLSRVIGHFMQPRYHCKLLPDGRIQGPKPPKDQGRAMIIDPKDFGWCRADGIATDMQATCPRWEQKSKREEMQGRAR